MDTQALTQTRMKSEARLPLKKPQLLWRTETTELRQATCSNTPADINKVKSELPKRVLPQVNYFREGNLWKKQDNI